MSRFFTDHPIYAFVFSVVGVLIFFKLIDILEVALT